MAETRKVTIEIDEEVEAYLLEVAGASAGAEGAVKGGKEKSVGAKLSEAAALVLREVSGVAVEESAAGEARAARFRGVSRERPRATVDAGGSQITARYLRER